MAATPYITPELFKFLRALKRNNNREWFHKNKPRFEEQVKEPLLRFIIDFGQRLEKISSHFNADPRPVGGSLFRIYRDTRFSKDKTPYKTNAGVHFRHEAGKDVHAPGFYLHLEPGGVFVGVGMWHPDGKACAAVRDAMVEHPDAWKKASRRKAFLQDFSLMGDSLKRPPRGYDKEHPLVEDLKRKDFIATCELTEADACDPKFMARFSALCRKAGPLQQFLCEAVGQPY
jgi:uncharacterized protein (TIGR02453 family)